MTTLYRSDKSFYTVREAGPWEGLVKAEVSKADPVHRWTGAKLSYADWLSVSAFLLWSHEETKSEAVVHLLYAEADSTGPESIIPIVLPQEGYSGLSIKPLPDKHPQAMQDAYRLGRLRPRNYIPIGSVHHHCGISAFQSGTDEADEKKKDGFHATLGHMDSKELDFHARVVWSGVQTGAVLSDWLEVSSSAAPHIPDAVAEAYLLWQVAQPSKAEFPIWWKEMILKPVPKPVETVRWADDAGWRASWEKEEKVADRRPSLFIAATDMAEVYNVDLSRLADDLAGLAAEDYTADLISLCVGCGMEPWEATDNLTRLAEDAEKRGADFDSAMDDAMMRDFT